MVTPSLRAVRRLCAARSVRVNKRTLAAEIDAGHGAPQQFPSQLSKNTLTLIIFARLMAL